MVKIWGIIIKEKGRDLLDVSLVLLEVGEGDVKGLREVLRRPCHEPVKG